MEIEVVPYEGDRFALSVTFAMKIPEEHAIADPHIGATQELGIFARIDTAPALGGPDLGIHPFGKGLWVMSFKGKTQRLMTRLRSFAIPRRVTDSFVFGR